jgi:tRNA threonylcarbamoyladenosine biosynthesis protein TsaB
MKLLALDTATELCSAALWIDGTVTTREQTRPRGHGELILPMIEQLLGEGGLSLAQLDAIAFGCGPGAFTGVRLAVSVAQGLGFAAGVPLIPVSDLRAIAAQVLTQQPQAGDRVLVCQDARMSEVYCGCYQRSQQLCTLVGLESVTSPSAVDVPVAWRGVSVSGAGSGFSAYAEALSRATRDLAQVYPALLPRAREIAQIAASEGQRAAVPAESAQPVYLRDEVASVPNQRLAAPSSHN